MKSLGSTLKIGAYSVVQAIKAQGLVDTAKLIGGAIDDAFLDYKYGIDAGTFADPKIIEPDHPSTPQANFYQPIRTRPFLKLLSELPIPENPKFVDIGAGKGKAQILASIFGIDNSIGVEFAHDLCVVARKNCARAKLKYPNINYQILELDAKDYNFDKTDNFILFNDPFFNELFEKVISNLMLSLKENPREVLLVYKNNPHRKIPALAKLKESFKYWDRTISGNYFEIFHFKANQ